MPANLVWILCDRHNDGTALCDQHHVFAFAILIEDFRITHRSLSAALVSSQPPQGSAQGLQAICRTNILEANVQKRYH